MSDTAGHEAHMKRAQNQGIRSRVDRPLKVVFLGAGSAFFGALFPDIINIPGADSGVMALVDIDKTRLELARKLGKKIIELSGKKGWKVVAETDRAKVLEGADYVVNCIEVSGTSCVEYDNDIPLSYGVDQCIGDTVGAGGLFKALRTVPVFLQVLKDVEKYCPDAPILNYTNPMSVMCLAAARVSKAKVIGLCHSVQGTSHQLATYAGIPYEELDWQCAGINHLAWFTKLEHRGESLYPALLKRLKDGVEVNDRKVYEHDPVRFEMMKHFGYFITESSGHLSEYLPYFRKRPELIKKYCRGGYLGESRFYASNWPQWRVDNDNNRKALLSGEKPIEVARSWEYASFIIEACETNQAFRIHGTVLNRGFITNLPQNNVVEVACMVDRNGITPTYHGSLPPECAAVCAGNLGFIDLAADACIHKSKEMAAKALMLDPLTAAVCSLDEIRAMTRKLFQAEKEFLPGYK